MMLLYGLYTVLARWQTFYTFANPLFLKDAKTCAVILICNLCCKSQSYAICITTFPQNTNKRRLCACAVRNGNDGFFLFCFDFFFHDIKSIFFFMIITFADFQLKVKCAIYLLGIFLCAQAKKGPMLG